MSRAWPGPGASPASCLCPRGCCRGTQRGKQAAAEPESSPIATIAEPAWPGGLSCSVPTARAGFCPCRKGNWGTNGVQRNSQTWLACTSLIGGKERHSTKTTVQNLWTPRCSIYPSEPLLAAAGCSSDPWGADKHHPCMAQEKENRIHTNPQPPARTARRPWQRHFLRPPGRHPAFSSGWCWVRGRAAPLLLSMVQRELRYFTFSFVIYLSNTND